jgi:hypothetical protein
MSRQKIGHFQNAQFQKKCTEKIFFISEMPNFRRKAQKKNWTFRKCTILEEMPNFRRNAQTKNWAFRKCPISEEMPRQKIGRF